MSRNILPILVTKVNPDDDGEHCGDCPFVVASICYPCCGIYCALFGRGLASSDDEGQPVPRLPECMAAEQAPQRSRVGWRA